MATGNWNNTSRRTIIGYFTNGEDAQRAIDDLVSEGFRPSEIGAAFRTGTGLAASSASTSPARAVAEDLELRTMVGLNSLEGGTSTAGAASDSNAVTPSGLSTGGGTEMSGAGRPGPIPGAEMSSTIPSSLPSSLRSSLPSTLHPAGTAQAANDVYRAQNTYPATGGFHETPKSGDNWWEKLKHVFGRDSASSSAPRSIDTVPDKTSRNFGTGEGHLGSDLNYDYAYSGAAFESAFFGMGIPPARAKQLSGRIRGGGAIVTVDILEGSPNAESILERNGGSVREEFPGQAASVDALRLADGEDRVQLFGQIQRVYPGYVSSTGAPTRKAS